MKYKYGIVDNIKIMAGFILLCLVFISPLHAADARFLYKENDISVISFEGDYDVDVPNGVYNTAAGKAVSNAFYEKNNDAYDFLIVFTQFEVKMGSGTRAFFSGVKNEVSGIGRQVFDNTQSYGSDGRLNGMIQMGGVLLEEQAGNPLRSEFDFTLDTIAHEMMHNWTAEVQFIDPHTGEVSDALLGRHDSHWHPLMHTGASLMYGAEWLENGNGTFTAVEQRKFFSPLDLYLAGFNTKQEVPDFYYIDNPAPFVDKETVNIKGSTVSGSKKSVSIDDIIAHEGERIPSAEDSQKDFRFGVILLTRPGQVVDASVLGRIQQVRKEFPTRLSILTGGRARAHWYPGAVRVEDVGESDYLESSGDRLAAFSLEDGLTWLKAQQHVEGYWEDKELTRLRDTAVALRVIKQNDASFSSLREFEAMDWLANQTPSNNDSMSRLFGLGSGVNTATFISLLNERQNNDGGWGVSQGYFSNPIDTALVIEHAAINPTRKHKGVQYLKSTQNDDGGWGSVEHGVSRVDATARVLVSLAAYGMKSGELIDDGLAFLLSHQDSNFGFGDDINGLIDSNIGDTALTISALYQLGRLADVNINEAVAYLSSRQSLDGDWEGSVYTTALVVNALKGISFGNWKAVSLTSGQTHIRDGERVQLNARVLNDGGSLLNAGLASFFMGNPESGGVLLGSVEIPVLGSGQAVDLLYYWDSFNQAGDHTLYVQLDPANELAERLENDNVASLEVSVQEAPEGVELEVTEADIHVSPSQLYHLPASLAISANVRNFGQTDAGMVNVELWKKSPLDGAASLAKSSQVMVNSRSNGLVNFTYDLTSAGRTEFIVKVDPHNQISESDKSNNLASTFLETVDAIDLVVESTDISFSGSPMLGQDMTFTLAIKNQGTLDSPTASIRYSIVGSVERQIQLDSAAIPAGQAIVREIVWRVDEVGTLNFVVEVDSEALVTESNEGNNQASFAFSTNELDGNNMTISHQGISFNPDPALEGYGLMIEAEVLNSGTNDLSNVQVSFYKGNPDSGGVFLGSDTVSFLAGEYATASMAWPVVDTTGTQLIYVVVDEADVIEEINENDNRAFKQVSVTPLPDLTISEADISFSPAAPVTNEAFQLAARVSNIGSQGAVNFPVSLYLGNPNDGGVLLETQTITELAGGAQHNVVFNYSTSLTEVISFYVLIDENDQVLEGNEFNNSASRPLAVQDSSFYVSSSFISPNNDGVQDTLLLSYTLDQASSTRIEVVDQYGKLIRTITQDEALNAAQIVWDGKNDLGTVANDGAYQVRLLDDNDALINATTTTIDTNRSSLKRAVFEDDFITSNMTCEFDGEFTGFSKDGKYGYLYKNSYLDFGFVQQQFAQVEVGTGRLTLLDGGSQGPYGTDFIGQYGDVAVFDNVVKNFVSGEELVYAVDITEGVGGGLRGASFGVDDQNLFNFPAFYEEPAIGKLSVLTTGQTLLNEILPADITGTLLTTGDADTSANGRGLFVIANADAQQPQEVRGIFASELRDAIEYGNFTAKLVDTATLSIADINVPVELDSDSYLSLTIDTSWSIDGSHIAISMPDHSIRVFNLQGKLVQAFAFPSLMSEFSLAASMPYIPDVNHAQKYSFSSDNKFLAFEVCQELSQTIPVASLVYNPNYPSGNFHSSCGVFVADLVSGEIEQIDEHLIGGTLEQNWGSPTGQPVWFDTDGPLFSSNYLNLRWLPGEHALIYDRADKYEYRHVYLKELGSSSRSLLGPQNYPFPLSVLSEIPISFSPDRQHLLLVQGSTPECLNNGDSDTYLVSSPDNLLTDLNAISSEQLGGILLSGTAADINFSQWKLEYLLTGEDSWKSISSASSKEKRDEEFITWVPNEIGSYLVRLTTSDLAGNQRQVVKPVTWGTVTTISNLEFSEVAISPNADGVQDQVAVSFNVIQPTHLVLEIRNEQGELVNAIASDFDMVGSQGFLIWDGRNSIGQIVDDGIYTVTLQDYEFTVVVDNNAPEVYGELVPLLSGDAKGNLYRYDSYELDKANYVGAAHYLSAIAKDELGLSLDLERSERGLNAWHFVQSITLLFDGNGDVIPNDIPIKIDDVGLYDYRLIATDLAGNTTVHLVDNLQLDQVVLASIVNQFELPRPGEEFLHRDDGANPDKTVNVPKVAAYNAYPVTSAISRRPEMIRFRAVESVGESIASVQVLYQENQGSPWEVSEIDSFVEIKSSEFCNEGFTNCANWSELPDAKEHTLDFTWNPEVLLPGMKYFVRLKITDVSSGEYLSNIAPLMVQDGISTTIGNVTPSILRSDEINDAIPLLIEPAGDIYSVTLLIQSEDDLRFREKTELETIYHDDEGFNINTINAPDRNMEVNADSLLACTSYSVSVQFQLFDGAVLPEIPVQETIKTNCLSVYYFLEPKIPEQCGVQGNEINIHLWPVAAEGFATQLQSLSIETVPENGPGQVLYNTNTPASGNHYQFTLDTSLLDEGALQLAYRLIDINDLETRDTFMVPIDKTAPSMDIYEPQENQLVCGRPFLEKYENGLEELFYAADVKATINDNSNRIPINQITNLPLSVYVDKEGSKKLQLQAVAREEIEAVLSAEGYSVLADLQDGRFVDGGLDVRLTYQREGEEVNHFDEAQDSYPEGGWSKAIFDANYGGGRILQGSLGPVGKNYSGWLTANVEVMDFSGYRSCESTEFQVDAIAVEGLSVTTNTELGSGLPDNKGNPYGALFSPNGDGFADTLSLSISVNEAATARIGVLRYTDTLSAQLLSDLVAGDFIDPEYQELFTTYNLNIGENTIDWNGQINGTELQDGKYVFVVQAQDGCGLKKVEDNLELLAFEIDTSAPQVAIEYPQFGDPVNMLIGVRASIGDLNQNSYSLSYESAQDPGRYIEINSGQGQRLHLDDQGLFLPIESQLIHNWNTSSLLGEYRLVLSSTDAAGNTAETSSVVNIADVSLLTSQFEVSPYLSVNGDGKLETLQIRFNVLQDSYLDLEIIDSNGLRVKALADNQLVSSGNFDYFWDGRDELASLALDGEYRVSLSLRHTQVVGLVQNEQISFVKDSQAPQISYANINNGFLPFDGAVVGSIQDDNLEGYTLSLQNPSTGFSTLLDASSNERTDAILARIDFETIADGSYRLVFEANDHAQNHVLIEDAVQIDTAPPQLAWETPRPNALFGKSTIKFLAEVEEQNPERLEINYVVASAPEQSHNIYSTSSVTGTLDYDWDISSLSSGEYSISMSVTDYAGNKVEESRTIRLDRLDPVVEIVAPADGQSIHSVENIIGSINDSNLLEYKLLLQHLNGEETELARGASNRQNAVIAKLDPLPEDGEYVLLLRATDKVDRTASVEHVISIDTTPPAQPSALTLDQQEGGYALDWLDNTETDLAGYAVYQNGIRINPALVKNSDYILANGIQGELEFYVTAVDSNGLESLPSDSVSIFVDNTPPSVTINSPYNGSKVSGLVDIFASVSSNRDDLRSYTLSVAPNDASSSFIELASGSELQANELLARWDTFNGQSDAYLIRLQAQDLEQNESSVEIVVQVDNEAPAQPDGLSVTSSADASGELVDIAWTENSEEDIAGYLLFRNGYLVNAENPPINDFNAYLIQGNSYTETISFDGEFEYFVIAVDDMGNQSVSSESAELLINYTTPDITYVSPAANEVFDSQLLIKLKSPDKDIETIDLAYRETGASTWNTITTIDSAPYDYLWDTDALVFGAYELRAIARDTSGGEGLPALVSVVKDDLSVPSAISNFDVISDAFNLSLNWDATTDDNIAHYLVSIWLNEIMLVDNVSVSTTSFSSIAPDTGNVRAEIVAIGTNGLASEPAQATARVFDVQSDLESLVVKSPAFIFKGETLPHADVFLSIAPFAPPGPPPAEPVNYVGVADSGGYFELFNITLDYGPSEYVIYAELDGDKSLVEAGFIAFSLPPDVPGNFTSSLSDPLVNVTLQWDALADPFIAGYYLFDQYGQLLSPTDLVPWNYLPFYSHLSASSANVYQDSNSPDNILSLYQAGYDEQACIADPQCSPEDFVSYFESSDANWTIQVSNLVDVLLGSIQVTWVDVDSIPEHYKAYTVIDGNRVELFDSQSITGSENFTSISFPSLVNNQFVRDIYLEVIEPAYPGQINKLAHLRGIVLVPQNVTSVDYELPNTHGNLEFTLIAENIFYQRSSPTSLSVEYGDLVAPEPASDLIAEVMDAEVSLSWLGSSSSDVAAYRVFRNGVQINQVGTVLEGCYAAPGEPPIVPGLECDDSLNSYGHVDYGMPNNQYEYDVVAIDAFGNQSSAVSVLVDVDTGTPAIPVNLVAIDDQEALEVNLTWTNGTGEPAASYLVYRQIGTETEMAAIAQVPEASYVDSDVQLGNSYSYQIVALDQWGNASEPSETVSVAFVDQIAPGQPSIDTPAPGGSIIDLASSFVEIAGTAQEPSRIVLYKNGAAYKETLAVGSVGSDYDFASAQSISVPQDFGYGAELEIKASQTADWLMVTRENDADGLALQNGVAILDRVSGAVIYHIEAGFGSGPEALTGILMEAEWIGQDTVGLVEMKSDQSYEIKTLNVASGVLAVQQLIPAATSGDVAFNAFRFLLSDNSLVYRVAVSDTDCLCELSHLNALDLSTGVITNNWEGISDINNFRFSPDGSIIFYTSKADGVGPDIVKAKNRLIGLSVELPQFSSPNFVFPEFVWNEAQDKVTYYNQVLNRIELLDLNTGFTQILESQTNSANVSLGRPSWAGDSVLYPVIYAFGSSFSLVQVLKWDAGIKELVEERSVSGQFYTYGFSGDVGGYLIQYDVSEVAGLVHLQVSAIPRQSNDIRYSFNFVELDQGQNIFTVQSVDNFGNASEHATPLVINYDSNEVNDLVMSLQLSKKTGLPNDEIEVSFMVSNQGNTFTPRVNLEVFVVSDEGGFRRLFSDDFESSYPGESRAFSFNWVPDTAGSYTIYASIDADESLNEIDELNNTASMQLEIYDSYEPKLTVTLESSLVTIGNIMNIDINLDNGGSELINDVLVIRAEDLEGYLVEEISQIDVNSLAHGEILQDSVSWEVPDIFAGDYQVVAQVHGLRTVAPFSVASDRNIALNLDFAEVVGAFENFPISLNLRNESQTDLFDTGRVDLLITNADQGLVYNTSRDIRRLLPDSESDIQFIWNSEDTEPGEYVVSANLFDAANVLIATSNQQFNIIMNSLLVKGDLALPAYIGSGDSIPWVLKLENQGNTDLVNLALELKLISNNGHVIASENFSLDLGRANATSLSGLFAQELSIGSYTVVASLTANQFGSTFERAVAESLVEVVDRTAPNILAAFPNDGDIVNSLENDLVLSVSDTESNVQSVEFQLNSGLWNTTEFANGYYVGDLSSLAEGQNSIAVRASDVAGNVTNPQSIDFEVDNTVPVISISGVIHGQHYNNSVSPIYSVTDANIGQVLGSLNGDIFESGMTIDEEGEYSIRVYAEDLAGNSINESRSFTIDTTAPQITVTGITDGEVTSGSVMLAIEFLDKHLAVSQILLNGANFEPGTIITADGDYLLNVSANDTAGNSSDETLAFSIDNSAPEIFVSGISDGEFYNDAVIPEIVISDDRLDQQSVLLNGLPYVPGTPITLEGSYVLDVSASDSVGNQSVRTIDFVIDTSSPLINIAGVVDGEMSNTDLTPIITISDTNPNTQLISLNGFPYISETIISDEGSYQLMVNASDLAGNESAEMLIFSIDKTPPPPPTITKPLNGDSILGTQLVTIQGVSEVSSTVTLSYGAQSWQVQAGLDGKFVSEITLIDGHYEVFASATDEAGNTSGTSSVVFNVQLDIDSPVIVISGVVDGQITNDTVSPVITVTDDYSLESVVITLNGTAWQSGQLVSDEGDYILMVVASDNTGNQSESSTIFTIDKTPPLISIEGVHDGQLYSHAVTPIISVIDSSHVTSEIMLNGQTFVSNTSVAQDGLYSLQIDSVDAAANQSTVALSFAIDQSPPSVPSLFAPAQSEIIETEQITFTGDAEPGSQIELLLLGPEGERNYSTSSNSIGLFEFNDISVETGDYLAVLVAVDDAGNMSGELHRDFSVDLQLIELTHVLTKSSDTLIWIPGPGHHGHTDHHNIDRWMEFLELTFNSNEYTLVRSESDFVNNLRSQQFDTVVLIGLTHVWGHPLIVSLDTQLEIRARVASGDGFVWVNTEGQLFDQWWDLVGAKSFGPIYGVDYVNIEANNATNTYYLDDNSIHATRLKTWGGEGIGEIVKCWWRWCSSKGRAMVLNEYGEGRTAVLGVNPSLASNEAESLTFFRALLDYVRPLPESDLLTASAYQLMWQLSNVDDTDLSIEQDLAPELTYVAVTDGEQLDDARAEWQWTNPGVSTMTVSSTILMPEIAGSYTIDVTVQEFGASTVLAEGNITIETSGLSTSEKEQELLDALHQYSPSFVEYFAWNIAIEKAEQATTMPRSTIEQKEDALEKLLQAVFWITFLNDDETILKKAGDLVKSYEIGLSKS